MKPPQSTRNNERGVVIIWSAFFMIMMLGFVALGIDVAKIMATRTELQNAADAAALAGASAIDLNTGKIRPDSALIRATLTAQHNKAFVDKPVPVTLLAGDVAVDPNLNTVFVKVRRDPTSDGSMITHVAQVLGIKNVEVTAVAKARTEPAGTIDCGLVPLFFDLSAQPPLHTGCNPGYTLKVGGGAGSNGNYGGLSYPECDNGPCAGMSPNGANAYRCNLQNGYCCPVSVGDVIDTKPGNMSGPTRQAMNARFAADTDRRQGICYSDYRGNGQRVVYVPLTTAPSKGGRATVQVTGFSAFFLKDLPGNGNQSIITGEFISEILPGSGGPANGTLYTIRLIQ
jgi:Flp pilus assembly protein TadG